MSEMNPSGTSPSEFTEAINQSINMKTTKRLNKQAQAEAQASAMQALADRRQREEERRREREERMRNRPPGTIEGKFEVFLILQSKYGISDAATGWILERAPYRPPEVEGIDLEVLGLPPIRFVYAWNEERIHAAALTFISECRQETNTLWSHPLVKGRFKLRPPLAS
jgi:hypothetical protein